MAEEKNVIALSNRHSSGIREAGFQPGEQIVFEVVGTVGALGEDSVAIEVNSVVIKKMPKNFREAAERTYVALRTQQSVG